MHSLEKGIEALKHTAYELPNWSTVGFRKVANTHKDEEKMLQKLKDMKASSTCWNKEFESLLQNLTPMVHKKDPNLIERQ